MRPTWKFAAWLNQLDSDPVEDENQIFIQTVYLVDFNERLDAHTTTDLLEAYYLDIATSEFGSWWTDEQDWPSIRSLNDFSLRAQIQHETSGLRELLAAAALRGAGV